MSPLVLLLGERAISLVGQGFALFPNFFLDFNNFRTCVLVFYMHFLSSNEPRICTLFEQKD